MATIDNLHLDIDADVVGPTPTATLTVTYDVDWNAADRDTHRQYREFWKLFGADKSPGEDGIDDQILAMQPNESLLPAVVFGSDGAAQSARELVVELRLNQLDEDVTGTDEVKIEISLEPYDPLPVSSTSNRVVLTV